MKKLCKCCTNIDQFVKKHGYDPVSNERSEESADCKCCGWEGGSLIKNNYCKECSKSIQAERTRIIKALEGLRAEIIEKIIGDYDEALSLEEIGYLTKDRVKQLKDKWL